MVSKLLHLRVNHNAISVVPSLIYVSSFTISLYYLIYYQINTIHFYVKVFFPEHQSKKSLL